MKFISLELSYDGVKKFFEFEEKTLIYSEKNSVGKSTLLRLLFYGIGYAIPGTYGIHFNKVQTTIFLHDNRGDIKVTRNDKIICVELNGTVEYEGEARGQEGELFEHIWGIESNLVLKNILGAMYMDQDKGWTLLNRGKVIGDIRFNVRDLLVGLSKNNISLVEKIAVLNNHKDVLQKTRQLLKIINVDDHDTAIGDDVKYNEESYKLLKNLNLKKTIVKKEINQVKKIINNQESLEKYIDSLNIMIEVNGEEILVTEDNMLRFNDNKQMLKSKLSLLTRNFEDIVSQIEIKKSQLSETTVDLFDSDRIVEKTLSQISNIPINTVLIENRENELKTKISEINLAIEQEFTDENELIDETKEWINKFSEILGVKDVVKDRNYIFTRDLKSISGTVYHKIVFAFKMAYLKVIEKHTGICLPIVLDSPSGREVTGLNLNSIVSILNEFFKGNQIIIASINRYQINELHEIKINNKIFETNI